MRSNHRESALRAVVDGLETELRRMRLWEPEPPSDDVLESTLPFCIDTLALWQWLQWRLIPRMRSVLAGKHPMPTRCAIYPLAEDCLEHLEDPSTLLLLIDRFDQLIRGDVAATMH